MEIDPVEGITSRSTAPINSWGPRRQAIRYVMDEVVTVRVRIMGRVQGVWYRGWTVDEARRLGLAGWVRNRLDGSVEAVFSGPRSAVRTMIDNCWQGPPAAKVSEITEQSDTEPVGPGFRQAPTE
jgi:acylphosphatase